MNIPVRPPLCSVMADLPVLDKDLIFFSCEQKPFIDIVNVCNVIRAKTKYMAYGDKEGPQKTFSPSSAKCAQHNSLCPIFFFAAQAATDTHARVALFILFNNFVAVPQQCTSCRERSGTKKCCAVALPASRLVLFLRLAGGHFR